MGGWCVGRVGKDAHPLPATREIERLNCKSWLGLAVTANAANVYARLPGSGSGDAGHYHNRCVEEQWLQLPFSCWPDARRLSDWWLVCQHRDLTDWS